MIAQPPETITLTPFDHFAPSNYTFYTTYLTLKDGVTCDEVIEVLQEGLRRTFTQLPYLGGKVHLQPHSTPGWRPGQLEVRYDVSDFKKGITLRQFHVKHLDPEEVGMSYEDLKERGFPLNVFQDEQLTTEELLPKLEDSPDVFSAQANFYDNALLLVSAIHHAVCDGTSFFNTWKVFASNCQFLQQPGSPWPEPPTKDSSDRTLMDQIWETEGTGIPMDQVKPEAWSLFDISPPGAPRLEAAQSLKTLSEDTMQAAVFYMTPEKFSALQKHCVRNGASGLNISGNDALSALVWRCMLKAKRKAALAGKRISTTADVVKDAEARVFITYDARPAISQSMPMVYLGNMFVVNVCSLPLTQLTSQETNLGLVAGAIRSVASKITRESLLDAYTVAKGVEDLGSIRLSRGHTPNSFDMVVTSFLMFQVEGVKFGGKVFANEGLPDAVRPLMARFNRASQVCFVLPRKAFGGVEFVLNLFEDEMDLLLEDEEFAEWCSFYSF